jgi:flagellar basal-body rod protein FlgB
MRILESRTMKVLGAALDISSARHEAISRNVANANTPGYKANDVDFSETLRQSMSLSGTSGSAGFKATRPGHFGSGSQAGQSMAVVMSRDPAGLSMRVDGSSVDIDLEMAKMAENVILYNTVSHILASKFGMLRYVISEGRR